MNYWLISDTHFNHSRLEEWGGRSGDWQDKLWEGIWNIPVDDTLLHLGDICIGEDTEIHAKLYLATNRAGGKVKTILVRGNHDKKSIHWYEQNGWDFACDGFDLLFQGHYLRFSHRPSWPHGNISFNIHGHTHGNLHRAEEYISFYDKTFHIDISPELVGYTPIRLDSLLKKK